VATENRLVESAADLLKRAALLLQAARAAEAVGLDRPYDARRLRETEAFLREVCEDVELEVRRRPPPAGRPGQPEVR
jgi:hypothetical protein